MHPALLKLRPYMTLQNFD